MSEVLELEERFNSFIGNWKRIRGIDTMIETKPRPGPDIGPALDDDMIPPVPDDTSFPSEPVRPIPIDTGDDDEED